MTLVLALAAAVGTLAPLRPHAQPATPLVERIGDTGFIQVQARQLPGARRAAAGAGLLAQPGGDRHRSHHLRPVVAVWPASETCARGGRRASRRHTGSHVCEDPGYALLFWAEPRESQREQRRRNSSRLSERRTPAGGADRRRERRICRRSYADLAAARRPARTCAASSPASSKALSIGEPIRASPRKHRRQASTSSQASSNTFYQRRDTPGSEGFHGKISR